MPKLPPALAALPRDVWLICLAVFLNRLGTMVVPFLLLYLKMELGFSVEMAALVVTLYGVGALLASLVGGILSDRFDPLPVIVLSYFLSAVMVLSILATKQLIWIQILVFFFALFAEAARPAIFSSITGWVPEASRSSSFALVRLAANLGFAVGPAMGGLLLAYSYRAIFIVDGFTSVLAGVVAWICLHTRRKLPKAELPAPPSRALSSYFTPLLDGFRDRKMLYFFFAILPVWIIYFQHEGVMGIYLVQEGGLDPSIYGWCFTINAILILCLELWITVLVSNWDFRNAMALGAAVSGLGFGLLAFGPLPMLAFASVSIWTIGEMLFAPASMTYVSLLAPPNRRGVYMGILSMNFILGQTLGVPLGAAVLTRFGGNAVWLGCLALGLLSGVLFLALPKPSHPN